jgi:hypothetical protein
VLQFKYAGSVVVAENPNLRRRRGLPLTKSAAILVADPMNMINYGPIVHTMNDTLRVLEIFSKKAHCVAGQIVGSIGKRGTLGDNIVTQLYAMDYQIVKALRPWSARYE